MPPIAEPPIPQTTSPRASCGLERQPTRPATARREGDRAARARRRAARSGRAPGSPRRRSHRHLRPRRPRRAPPARPPRPRRRPRPARRSPITLPAETVAPSPTSTRWARIEPMTSASAPTEQPSSSTLLGDHRAVVDPRAPSAAPPARCDGRVDRDLGPGRDPRPAGRPSSSVSHRALDDVPARLQVALRGPDVHPVAVEAQPVEAVADQLAGRSRARSRPAARRGSGRCTEGSIT